MRRELERFAIRGDGLGITSCDAFAFLPPRAKLIRAGSILSLVQRPMKPLESVPTFLVRMHGRVIRARRGPLHQVRSRACPRHRTTCSGRNLCEEQWHQADEARKRLRGGAFRMGRARKVGRAPGPGGRQASRPARLPANRCPWGKPGAWMERRESARAASLP